MDAIFEHRMATDYRAGCELAILSNDSVMADMAMLHHQCPGPDPGVTTKASVNRHQRIDLNGLINHGMENQIAGLPIPMLGRISYHCGGVDHQAPPKTSIGLSVIAAHTANVEDTKGVMSEPEFFRDHAHASPNGLEAAPLIAERMSEVARCRS